MEYKLWSANLFENKPVYNANILSNQLYIMHTDSNLIMLSPCWMCFSLNCDEIYVHGIKHLSTIETILISNK